MSCLVEGCLNKYKCRGYCSTHYKQILKHGKVNLLGPEQHGQSLSPEYRSWGQMKARCLNKNHHAYARYGGRGITIHSRWLNSFSNFINDMGLRPKGTSLDRINPFGNYEPSNCRWATDLEQARTRRNSTPFTGVHFDRVKHSWRATLNYKGQKVLNRRFKNFDDAVRAREHAVKVYLSG